MINATSSFYSGSISYNTLSIAPSQSTSTFTSNEGAFSKLSKSIGGDGSTISKDQVDSFISKSNSDDSNSVDKKKLELLKKVQSNWNNISGGKDNITEGDLADSDIDIKLLGQSGGDDSVPTISYGSDSENDNVVSININKNKNTGVTTSFAALAASVGAGSNKISKDQLYSFLQSLVNDSSASGADNNAEIAFVKRIINKFDTISSGSDYITSFSGVQNSEDSVEEIPAKKPDGTVSTVEYTV